MNAKKPSLIVMLCILFLFGVALLLLARSCVVLPEECSLRADDLDTLRAVASLLGSNTEEVRCGFLAGHRSDYRDASFAFIKLRDGILESLNDSADLFFSAGSEVNHLQESQVDNLVAEATKIAPSWFRAELESISDLAVYSIQLEGAFRVWLFQDIRAESVYCALALTSPISPNSPKHAKQTE